MNMLAILLFLCVVYLLLGVTTTAYLIHETLGSPYAKCCKYSEYALMTGVVLIVVFILWPYLLYDYIKNTP